jgi:DNA polymerase-3 subunit gamma/tau
MDKQTYQVLARKWRPPVFPDVIGQEHVTRTLANSISAGRVGHAFLFSGPRGCGKTTTARILSKSLNCANGPTPDPCNKCESCLEIAAGTSMDVLEIDAASNTGVDSIRDLRESTAYMPGKSRFKVYIIDEVHMLSKNAFNALLKTLEEPPPHVKFILATTDPVKVPLTILSRCQRYDFKRVTRAGLVAHMSGILGKEGIPFTPGSLTVIAGQAGGSVRDALSLLEQVIAYCDGRLDEERTAAALGLIDRRLVVSLIKSVVERDRAACASLMDSAYTFGYDMKLLAEELMVGMRNLLVLKSGGEKGLDEVATQDEIADLGPLTGLMSLPAMHRAFDVLVQAVDHSSRSQHPRIVLEMALMKLMVLEPLRPVEELLARIAGMEARFSTGQATEKGEEKAGRGIQSAVGTAPPVGSEQDPRWVGVLDAIKEVNPSMASRIIHGRFISLEDDVLEISFDPGSAHLSYARNNLEFLGKAVSRHFGRPVKVALSETGGGGRVARSAAEEKARRESDAARKARDEEMSHPVIQDAVRVFGGRVVQTSKDGGK